MSRVVVILLAVLHQQHHPHPHEQNPDQVNGTRPVENHAAEHRKSDPEDLRRRRVLILSEPS
jgi:hypothetical protein